jgi:hypothetical protein
MSAQPIAGKPRADDLRATALQLIRDGLCPRDVAVALNLDIEALRRLVGGCSECYE